MSEFATNLESIDLLESMKSPKLELHLKNIIPIPVLLVKTSLSLEDTTPYTIIRAFFVLMFEIDANISSSPIPQSDTTEPGFLDETVKDQSFDSAENQASVLPGPSTATIDSITSPKYLDSFIHFIQFCHLCSKGKIPPIHYSLATTPEIDSWFTSINLASKISATANSK